MLWGERYVVSLLLDFLGYFVAHHYVAKPAHARVVGRCTTEKASTLRGYEVAVLEMAAFFSQNRAISLPPMTLACSGFVRHVESPARGK